MSTQKPVELKRALSVLSDHDDIDTLSTMLNKLENPDIGQESDAPSYHRVVLLYANAIANKETLAVCSQAKDMLTLRAKYINTNDQVEVKQLAAATFKFNNGVAEVYAGDDKKQTTNIVPIPNVGEFYQDLSDLYAFTRNPKAKTFAVKRLQILGQKYNMYKMLNFNVESNGISLDERDFYSVGTLNNSPEITPQDTIARP